MVVRIDQTSQGQRVLVVDDDRLVLGGIVGALEAAGFHVWSAESGEEAIRVAAHVRPDVVVTDLRMPGMDGLALLSRLGTAPAGDPRVVIYTATPPATRARGEGQDVLWISKTPGHRTLIDALKEGRHGT